METTALNVKVIIGSTRKNRFSDKPAHWIFDELKQRNLVQAELIDLRDWPLPFYNEILPPIAIAGNYTELLAKQWSEKIKEADAFIIVTPEYNHGYPAVLKNALDWLYTEWNNKPVGFVSWGSVMGARSVEQLREVVIELQMVPIRNAIHIRSFRTLMDEQGNLKQDAFKPLEKMVNTFFDQLFWWAKHLKAARAINVPSYM